MGGTTVGGLSLSLSPVVVFSRKSELGTRLVVGDLWPEPLARKNVSIVMWGSVCACESNATSVRLVACSTVCV